MCLQCVSTCVCTYVQYVSVYLCMCVRVVCVCSREILYCFKYIIMHKLLHVIYCFKLSLCDNNDSSIIAIGKAHSR